MVCDFISLILIKSVSTMITLISLGVFDNKAAISISTAEMIIR